MGPSAANTCRRKTRFPEILSQRRWIIRVRCIPSLYQLWLNDFGIRQNYYIGTQQGLTFCSKGWFPQYFFPSVFFATFLVMARGWTSTMTAIKEISDETMCWEMEEKKWLINDFGGERKDKSWLYINGRTDRQRNSLTDRNWALTKKKKRKEKNEWIYI